MSHLALAFAHSQHDRPLVWLHGEIRSPPFSAAARPMPVIGARCHELRVVDERVTWRIVYRLDPDAVVILEVFAKKAAQTPKHVIETCRVRLRRYDNA